MINRRQLLQTTLVAPFAGAISVARPKLKKATIPEIARFVGVQDMGNLKIAEEARPSVFHLHTKYTMPMTAEQRQEAKRQFCGDCPIGPYTNDIYDRVEHQRHMGWPLFWGVVLTERDHRFFLQEQAVKFIRDRAQRWEVYPGHDPDGYCIHDVVRARNRIARMTRRGCNNLVCNKAGLTRLRMIVALPKREHDSFEYRWKANIAGMHNITMVPGGDEPFVLLGYKGRNVYDGGFMASVRVGRGRNGSDEVAFYDCGIDKYWLRVV